MAAVASYLASLSPSPSPLVTSIHMCSPSFLSLSLSPPFRPLRSPALSISYPSLPAVFRYLPPLPFSLSNTQNLSVFPALCHQEKKHTQFARAAAFMRAGECERDGGGVVGWGVHSIEKRERERDRESRNGEELTRAKIHLLFPERRQGGGKTKERRVMQLQGCSKRGKTSSL